MGILLTPLAQAFWCAWAWRGVGGVASPGPRLLLQGLCGLAVLVVLAAGTELLVGPEILRRVLGLWGRVVARLWLIASCIGFLAVLG